MENDELSFMNEAFELAQQAYREDEVPVGAVVVLDNKIIGRGYNSVIRRSDPTAHAEIIALREAGQTIGNYRIMNAELYVTLEPCLMCYSAMVHARIVNLYYGAFDSKTGIFSTGIFFDIKKIFNHTINAKSGIMLEATSKLIQLFFQERRGARVVERGGLENR